jgi:ribonuclease J
VAAELDNIFSKISGRIFFTSFASNVERIGSAIATAARYGRKVVFMGKAMERTVAIAANLGLLSISKDIWVNLQTARDLPPDKLLFMLSGCQGEQSSALYSVVSNSRKTVKMTEGDTLIFSSRIIPGNERSVNSAINLATRAGAEVILPPMKLVHVSGHAFPKELAKTIRLLNPTHFIPIHGEYRHMKANAKIASLCGIKNIHILETGEQLTFIGDTSIEKSRVSVAPRYVDFYGDIMDTEDVQAIKTIYREGLLIIKKTGNQVKAATLGFTLSRGNNKALTREITTLLKSDMTDDITDVAKKYLKKNLGRKPHIIVV